MNFSMVFKSMGFVLGIEAAAMLPALLVALLYHEPVLPFALSIVILVVLGAVLYRIRPATPAIYGRDGFAIVALGWLLISIFGALPFLFSGAIASPIDAFFESASGFSTTGASVLSDVELLPRGILFWRSITHWIGGMGVLVLTLAILPLTGANSLHILRAESAGPNPGKIVPKMRETVKILYGLYVALAALQAVLLLLAGMPLYDALIHTFSTAGTGGFSNQLASVGSYNNLGFEVIITLFMLAFSINFSLYYQLLKRNFKEVLGNHELWFFLGVVGCSILLIAVNLWGSVFRSLWEALRYASFQVASIISSTGFFTTDFDLWPSFSKMVLVFLMFIGASAGSTGGGLKCIRVLLLLKVAKRSVVQMLHPRSVYRVRIGGKAVEEETLEEVLIFFFLYIGLFVLATLAVSLEGKDILTTTTAVAASIGNVGAGLGMVGPMGSFANFSAGSKLVLSFCMIAGRLEIYPLLLMLSASFWRRSSL